jgi:hypothetical protein
MKTKMCNFDVMKFHCNTATPQHRNTATPQHRNTKIRCWCKLLFNYLFSVMFVNFGFSQNCIFENPTWPPNGVFNPCYLGSGSLTQIGQNGPDPCGVPPGPSYNYNGKIWTIDGNLIIDRHSIFTNCTFNFTPTGSISFGKHPIVGSMTGPGPIRVTFENCTFIGCNNDYWLGIIYNVSNIDRGPILTITNSTVQNALIGIKVITTSKFNGELTLDNVIFNNNDIGIEYVGEYSMKINSVRGCTFIGGNTGIFINNFPRRNSSDSKAIFFQGNNVFQDLNIGIHCENTEGLSVQNCNFSSCIKGIVVKNLKATGLENLLLFENTFLFTQNCAICLDKLNVGSKGFIIQNTISGDHNYISKYGINIANTDMSSLSISASPYIQNFSEGIRIYNSHFRSYLNIIRNLNINANKRGIQLLNFELNKNSINISNNELNSNEFSGLSVFGNKLGNIKNNTISAVHNTDFNLALYDTELFNLEGNTMTSLFEGPEFRPHMLLANGFGNKLCCNTVVNKAGGLHIYGTNSLTGIRNTTFNNNNFILENSIIGDNPHAGNRFKGQTTGFLLAADPVKNTFLINPSEGNATLGLMAPSVLDPIIEDTWFPKDLFGSSISCSPGCGFNRRSFNFNEDQDELDIPDLGGCYPVGLDRDGDGICDQNDPDPDDPCSPIMTDSDGDGVCDPIDPAPNDSCIPLSLDTDGDGVCDTSDPDPNDPCDPNNLDTDGDGVCNLYDGDPTVPFIPFVDPVNGNCLPITDYNGDHRIQLGCAPEGLTFDIANLEKLTNYPVVNSPYDALNVIESKEALYKILHSTPVLRQQSEVLATSYDNLCDDDIRFFIEVEYLLEDYHKQSNYTNNNIKKKELYLQRLSKLAAFLTDTILSDSIHLVRINLSGETVFDEIKNLYNQLTNDKVGKQQILINKINSLPQNNPVYSTQKEYYQIFYNKFILENPLSFSETGALSLMADLCPLEYGKVVYKARSVLLGEEIEDEEDFTDNCLSVEFRRKDYEPVSEQKTMFCHVFPNPAQDKLFIQTTFEIAEIQLCNHLGTLVFENKNIFGSSYTLDAASLPAGLYYLTTLGNKGESVFNKVVLFR